MNKEEMLQLSSVKNFKSIIFRTKHFFDSVEANIVFTKTILEEFHTTDVKGFKKIKKITEFTKNKLSYVYELGFIALYANFESFIVDLTKELIKKYPKSFKSEKCISVSDLKEHKNIDDAIDYYIDAYAIDKTSNLMVWREYTNTQFGIDIFNKDNKNWDLLFILSSLRNCYLHSYGRTNSRFIKQMKKIINSSIPLHDKIRLDRKKNYYSLYKLMLIIISSKK